MPLSNDWREFLEKLNSRGVDYIIVGAHCLAFHAQPRFTGDLDILVRPSLQNARAIVDLLNEFGFRASRFQPSDFIEPSQVIQLGRAPNRIDLLTSISGVDTKDAFATRLATTLDGIPVFVLSREALIRNKRVVDRPQDRADLEMLER